MRVLTSFSRHLGDVEAGDVGVVGMLAHLALEHIRLVRVAFLNGKAMKDANDCDAPAREDTKPLETDKRWLQLKALCSTCASRPGVDT